MKLRFYKQLRTSGSSVNPSVEMSSPVVVTIGGSGTSSSG